MESAVPLSPALLIDVMRFGWVSMRIGSPTVATSSTTSTFKLARALRKPAGHRLLTVARFSPEKNLMAAGRAFLAFAAQRPSTEAWRWKIAGYGPQQTELKALVERSDGRIELLGAKDYQELPTTLAAADIYWQPSLRDSWALPVNEAMAAGMPVIVSDRCGCHEDLVTPQTGWTFDPTSDESMTEALNLAADAHAQWPLMGIASTELIQEWGLPRFSSGLLEAARLAVT